jgi:MoaA/NifB/PqqE/SkfB family radical SAM enzyme
LEYPELFTLLERLCGVVFRSFTTNGLLLDEDWLDRLAIVAPDKVHISIHFPDSQPEVERVISQVKMLSTREINSGINFLVTRSNLPSAIAAAATVRQAGIGNERIVYLPMRGQDTPNTHPATDGASSWQQILPVDDLSARMR